MDWTAVISRNRRLLLGIVAALAAVVAGRDVLARQAYLAALSVLRPAEAAVRRLIVITARGLVLKTPAAREFPAGLAFGGKTAVTERAPAFALLDPLKRFDGHVWAADEDDPDEDGMAFVSALPRISVPGLIDPRFASPKPVLSPDEPVNAAALASRLAALQHALATLPRQARRFARWRTRQHQLLQERTRPFKPLRLSPLRPGPPPGHRDRHVRQVDAVLSDCHHFAGEALAEDSG